MSRTSLILILTVYSLAASVFAESNYPQYRGSPTGLADDKDLPTQWSTTKNVVWNTQIPGRGWSCPIVWGDKIFLTSVIKMGDLEAPKKGLYFGGERPDPSPDTHLWMVYCIDWKTGKILWEKLAHQGVPQQSIHIKNTYASETPVTDGQRLYAYFGNLGLFCYDLDGNQLWSQKWGSSKIIYDWGTAASPVLHQDRIYILNDNQEQSFLVALDKKTGNEIWRVNRDEKSNWATPYIWQNPQRTELITSAKGAVRSYDLDGKLLWQLTGMSSIVIPTPLTGHGLLYISSGYVGDKTRPIYAIRPGAAGDISLKDDQASNKFIAWSQKKAGPYNPSPLIYGDYLYVLYDLGHLGCYHALTGKEVYPKQKIDPKAKAFTSSPWANNDKIFCLSEDGDTFIIEAGPNFKVISQNNLNEMCMATPAILRGNIIIRTLTKLYRIQNQQ